MTDMTGVDMEKCKRIVQYFWDPEPKNDTAPEAPIWCLGQQYTPHTLRDSNNETGTSESHPISDTQSRKWPGINSTIDTHRSIDRAGEAIHDITASIWPEEFLIDFESRIWMTYRSNFHPIPRSNAPDANASMSLGVRLRSQLMDSHGFTSDTGWGCMIRSGQSLLANTLSILLLGRGETTLPNQPDGES